MPPGLCERERTVISNEPLALVRLDVHDARSGIERRRRLALARAARAADLARRIVPGCGLALCVFAFGHAALGLAGTFDRVERAKLRASMPSLRRLAAHELDIDLSGVGEYDAALARLIGQLRIRQLIGGARVEVHHCPAWMSSEFSGSSAEVLWVDAGNGPAVEPVEA